jgi:hypothetical protein
MKPLPYLLLTPLPHPFTQALAIFENRFLWFDEMTYYYTFWNTKYSAKDPKSNLRTLSI